MKSKKPSYHDLYIRTSRIPRTSIFDLPFNLMVTCTRTGGWELWEIPSTDTGIKDYKQVAGEYVNNVERGLRLDVSGTVIVDSLSAFFHEIEKEGYEEQR